MADVNWKSIGGISIIGGLIGYIGAWNKDRRYRKHLVNKFGVFDAESFNADEIDAVCENCGEGYDSDQWGGRPSICADCGYCKSCNQDFILDEGCCGWYEDAPESERWVNNDPFDAESFSAEEVLDINEIVDDLYNESKLMDIVHKRYINDRCVGCNFRFNKNHAFWTLMGHYKVCEKCENEDNEKWLAAESFSAESQFGDPEWKTKVIANNDGKPSPYDGRLKWDISYYTPLGRTFHGDISKNPKQKHEGYTVLINCDNLGGCGGNKRMDISPKLLNLTKLLMIYSQVK